jgi:hypothetical protein
MRTGSWTWKTSAALVVLAIPVFARASGELCVRDSQLAKGSVIRFAPIDLSAPGTKMLRGVINVDGLCAPIEGSGESTAHGAVFIGLRARLGRGTQELDYHMVADRTLRATGTISTTDPRGFYQTRAVWTPIECDAAPTCDER